MLPAGDETPQTLQRDGVFVSLAHAPIDISFAVNIVRSPKAGAVVLFIGTTRDNMDGKPVKQLQYTAYIAKALRSLLSIAEDMKRKHSLEAIAMIHRLGVCPVGEESILIAVSSAHRQAAWRGGEEALEECKAKVEVWKLEEFGGDEAGVWRANRDGAVGERITTDEMQGAP